MLKEYGKVEQMNYFSFALYRFFWKQWLSGESVFISCACFIDRGKIRSLISMEKIKGYEKVDFKIE